MSIKYSSLFLNAFKKKDLNRQDSIIQKNIECNKCLLPSHGFTLVELLIAMLIMMFVSIAAVTIHKVNSESALKETLKQDLSQNLRAGIYTIGRDVRMAGNCFRLLGIQNSTIQVYVPGREIIDGSGLSSRVVEDGWFVHADATAGVQDGALPIYGIDGGLDSNDTLTILRADMETGAPLGYVAKGGYGMSSPNILNLVEPFREGRLANNDIIAIVSDSKTTFFEVLDLGAKNKELLASSNKLSINLGGRFTPPSNEFVPSAASKTYFPEGAAVYNLKNVVFVTYYLDRDNNTLMADYHDVTKTNPDNTRVGLVEIADNIEDFQVFYYMESDTVNQALAAQSRNTSFNYFINNRVKAVSIALTAKSPAPYGSGNKYTRPALFNRGAGSVADDHYRATLTETIFLRSF